MVSINLYISKGVDGGQKEGVDMEYDCISKLNPVLNKIQKSMSCALIAQFEISMYGIFMVTTSHFYLVYVGVSQ